MKRNYSATAVLYGGCRSICLVLAQRSDRTRDHRPPLARQDRVLPNTAVWTWGEWGGGGSPGAWGVRKKLQIYFTSGENEHLEGSKEPYGDSFESK